MMWKSMPSVFFCRRQISTQHKLASNQSLQLCSDGRETVGMQGLTLLY